MKVTVKFITADGLESYHEMSEELAKRHSFIKPLRQRQRYVSMEADLIADGHQFDTREYELIGREVMYVFRERR